MIFSRVEVKVEATANHATSSSRYSTTVLVRFSACLSFMVIGLILAVLSFLPDGRELGIGATIAGLFAAVLGASASERAWVERARRQP